MKQLFCILLAVLFGGSALRAQTPPDRRGEVVTVTPEYDGITTWAPIDSKYHIRNEGGSDGQGLCVIASMVINGGAQGIADFRLGKECKLWKAAKRRPGGYSPARLQSLLKELYPDLKWFSWEGREIDLIRRFTGEGYPVAATMSTGQLYHYMPIHHMISIAHAGPKYVSVVDNNDPGKWHWMPAAEYARRFVDGGTGWLVVLLEKPVYAVVALAGFWLTVSALAAGAILCFARGYSLCRP